MPRAVCTECRRRNIRCEGGGAEGDRICRRCRTAVPQRACSFVLPVTTTTDLSDDELSDGVGPRMDDGAKVASLAQRSSVVAGDAILNDQFTSLSITTGADSKSTTSAAVPVSQVASTTTTKTASRSKRAPRKRAPAMQPQPNAIMSALSTDQQDKMPRPKNARVAALSGSASRQPSAPVDQPRSEPATMAEDAAAGPSTAKSTSDVHPLPTRIDMDTLRILDGHIAALLKVVDPPKYHANKASPAELRALGNPTLVDDICYILAPQLWEHDSHHEAYQIATVIGYALYRRARDQRTPPTLVKEYLEKHLAEGHWGPKRLWAGKYTDAEVDAHIEEFGVWQRAFEKNGVVKEPVDPSGEVEPWGEYETTFLRKLIDVLDSKIQLGGR